MNVLSEGKSSDGTERISFCMLVSTTPGAIDIELMLFALPSSAMQRDHMSNPAFETQYADHEPMGRMEAPLEMTVTRLCCSPPSSE